MFRVSFVALCLWTLPIYAQCPPGWNPTSCDTLGAPATGACADELASAIQLITCIGLAKNSAAIIDCGTRLTNNPGKILIGDAGDAYIYTAYNCWRDTPNGEFDLRWDASNHCNCIVIDPSQCPYPGLERTACSPAILAAGLLHELCHAKTFTATATTCGSIEKYDDPCVLPQNEVLCACLELDILGCLIQSDCVPMECTQDLLDRGKVVLEFKNENLRCLGIVR